MHLFLIAFLYHVGVCSNAAYDTMKGLSNTETDFRLEEGVLSRGTCRHITTLFQNRWVIFPTSKYTPPEI